MMKEFQLNYQIYPLVTGQLDKFIFQNSDEEGGTVLLQATRIKEPYGSDDIIWSSADESIATVDAGTVRAIRTGVTDITAQLPDGTSELCRIQVIDNFARLTNSRLSLNTDRLVLNKEDGSMLFPVFSSYDYFQSGMLDTTIDWTSSDSEIAAVNHLGRIYARVPGEAVITACCKDTGRSASCHVTVIEKSKEELFADPVQDYKQEACIIKTGGREALKLPDDFSNEPVSFCSMDNRITGVDEKGIVTAYAVGSTTICATFINGGHRCLFPVTIEKSVEQTVSRIELSKTKNELAVGQTDKIYAVVFPATKLETTLNWSSSNENTVKIVRQHINLSGLDEVIVEAVGEGEAILTGVYSEADKVHTVSCSYFVKGKADKITEIIFPDKLTLEPDQVQEPEVQIKYATGRVSRGDFDKLIFLSEDRKTATIDRNGTIKAYKEGKTCICVVAADSLTKDAGGELNKLNDLWSIREKGSLLKLQGLLENAVYCKTTVVVSLESNCLRNLHIPYEAVTNHSICLLWNRACLCDTDTFDHYEVFLDGQRIAKTKKLCYTAENLSCDTNYHFIVCAVDIGEQKIAEKKISARTKPATTCVLDVTKAPYSAIGNGLVLDTEAIQRAIDDCPENGTVLLPKGFVFHCGALFLKGNMTFQVDAILLGSERPEDYPPVVCRWEGYRKMRLTKENEKQTVSVFDDNVYSHASLINVGVYDEAEPKSCAPYMTENVIICGKGMINGNGFRVSYNEGPCWYINKKGLPLPQSPKENQDIRGRLIAMYNVRHAYIKDITAAYGASWTIQPVFCDRITFDGVKVISMGNGRTGVMEGMLILNGDGIDPDSSTNVNIVNSIFTVGDDAVAIKSGRNRQGNELAKPSAYIRVTDCISCGSKGAFCIGSEQAGGAHDILFQNLTARNLMNFGLWIKTAPCRGGLVEDVLWRDCTIEDTGGALQIEYNHGGTEDPAEVLPETRRITYENIRFIGKNKFGIRIIGVKDSPICDVSFRGGSFSDFEATKDKKFYLSACERLSFLDFELPEGYEWETDSDNE